MRVLQVKPFAVSSDAFRGCWRSHKLTGGPRSPARKCAFARSCASLSKEMHWQEVAIQPSQRPLLPRSGHCLASMPGDSATQAVIFGGYTEDEAKQRAATNDAWIFSLHEGSWSQPDLGSSKLPRARIAAQAVCVGNNIWLMGGWDPGSQGDGGQILNDVWRLDLSSWTWTEASIQGEHGVSLQPISRFQAAAVGDQIYIHTHRSLDDILVLNVADPSKPHLRQIPVGGTHGATPSARGLHTVTAADNKLYLFGGASQKGQMLNDLWVLDLGTMQWTQLQPQGKAPHIRCSHTAVLVGQDIIFCGGSYYREDGSGLQPLDDIFSYSITRDLWQKHEVSGRGPAARNAAVACLIDKNKLLLHGGWEPFKNTFSDSFVLHC